MKFEKIRISALIFSTFGIYSLSMAASPTQWILKNQTSQIIEVKCSGKTGEAKINPKLLPLIVPAHQNRTHIWGSNWHNDGMGLNPARWECEARALDNSQAPAKISFESQWGETIELTLNQDTKELRLSKASKEENRVQ